MTLPHFLGSKHHATWSKNCIKQRLLSKGRLGVGFGQVEKQMPKEDQEVSKEAMGTMGTMGGWGWRQGCV